MRGIVFIAIILTFSVFLIPSMSSDYSYGHEESRGPIIDSTTGNRFSHVDAKNIPPLKFQRGFSYIGPSDIFHIGVAILTFSDDFKWLISDYRIDPFPTVIGASNDKPIEVIRCYGADYYHVLGTSLVTSIPRPEEIEIY